MLHLFFTFSRTCCRETGYRRCAIGRQSYATSAVTDWKGGVYNAGSERLNLTKDEIARLLLERQPFFLTYGPVGADEDRRDYAVSYARLNALGYGTEVDAGAGIDELLAAVDLLPGPVD